MFGKLNGLKDVLAKLQRGVEEDKLVREQTLDVKDRD